MSTSADNVFSELTPPGRGGISTLGLLGPDVCQALGRIFRGKHGGLPQPGQLAYGHVVDQDGRTIDEVIVRGSSAARPDAQTASWAGPDAGTASPRAAGAVEEMEIHCHGGPAAVLALAARLEELGLRRLDWPDYLRRRAALAGLSQVALESELLLPHLATLPTALVVIRQRNGLLAEAVERAEKLVAAGGVSAALGEIDALLSAYEHVGRHIERQPRVAILGAPNVGKSSLLNRLVGHERAIVTDLPGTTRDVVTETTDLVGLPVVLADTAGLPITGEGRRPADLAEQLGVERSRAEALQADVLLYLVDLSRPPSPDEQQWVAGRPPTSVLVGAKADLSPFAGCHGCDVGSRDPSLQGTVAEPTFAKATAGRQRNRGTRADLVEGGSFPVAVEVATSSLTGQGVDQLAERILAALGFRWPAEDEAVPFTARQATCLRAARAALAAGDAQTAQLALSALVAPAHDAARLSRRAGIGASGPAQAG